VPAAYFSGDLSVSNHKFDPSSPDDGRWTIDDAPPSIVYRRSSKAGTHLRFDALSTADHKSTPRFEAKPSPLRLFISSNDVTAPAPLHPLLALLRRLALDQKQ